MLDQILSVILTHVADEVRWDISGTNGIGHFVEVALCCQCGNMIAIEVSTVFRGPPEGRPLEGCDHRLIDPSAHGPCHEHVSGEFSEVNRMQLGVGKMLSLYFLGEMCLQPLVVGSCR